MPLYFKIAIRYLFAKKSTGAINIITGISVIGIAIGTASLILILSVFNGFETLMKQSLDTFNPDLKIALVEGKFFNPDTIISELYTIDNIDLISKTVEDVAIFDYKEVQHVGILKGVDPIYQNVSDINKAIIRGEMVLKNEGFNYCSLGAVLASKLAINLRDPLSTLKIYMPKRRRRGALDSEFKTRNISPGSIFSLKNQKDHEYVMADLSFVQELLELRKEVSFLEIALTDTNKSIETQKVIIESIGPKYNVMDRYEQDESFLKVMNIEKWMAFLILGFTLLLIAFNVIGSLWMIVIEKKKDISVLQALGIEKHLIKKIFFTEGFLISAIGFLIGLVVAVLLYQGQLRYGFLGVSNGFSSVSYPVLMIISDVLAVFGLVMTLGLLASIPATRRAANISAYIRSE